jgi:prophage antirepressor-like protein
MKKTGKNTRKKACSFFGSRLGQTKDKRFCGRYLNGIKTAAYFLLGSVISLNVKTEKWNGHNIRFVWHNDDWWGVAKDVCDALGYRDAHNMTRNLDKEEKDTHNVSTPGGNQEMAIVSETGIYEAIFSSRRKEAKQFKKWVKQTLKELRQATGLEGFQIFRMLDRQHQKEAMAKLKASLRQPARVDFIKANAIANKAISNMFGFPKMLKKDEMTPDMLVMRENALDDAVELMGVKDKFNLDISVSELIYSSYQ